MALPKSVKQQAKKAQQVHDAVYKQQEGNESGVSTNADDPMSGQESSAEGSSPPTLEVVPTETVVVSDPVEPIEPAAPIAENTVADPAEDTPEYWKHKYHSIYGKYKAEVPRLHKEIKELRTQNTNQQSLIERLNIAPPPVVAPAVDVPETTNKLLEDSEVEAYGADLIDVIKRASREEMAPEVSNLKKENAELRQQLNTVNTTVTSNAKQKVYDALDTEIDSLNANWRELNSDEGFLYWLSMVDPYTNIVRRDLLSQAFEDNDAARVIAFFKGYLNENAVVSTQSNGPPAAANRTPAVDMESLAAPGKPKGGGAPGTQEGQQTWRQTEISAFYADVRRGVYKDNPKEKLRLEKSIMKAVQSNRVVA